MLVLSRKLGERIFIGNDTVITVVDIDRGRIRLGIEAPRDVSIHREEVRLSQLRQSASSESDGVSTSPTPAS